MKMKELEKRIDRKGFIYLQEFRDDTFAIYSQWLKKNTTNNLKEDTLVGYELIKIRKNIEHMIAGVNYAPSESYPGEKSWGTEGWTFKTLKEAKERLSKYTLELANLPSSKVNLDTLI